jgi:hypothetical protein
MLRVNDKQITPFRLATKRNYRSDKTLFIGEPVTAQINFGAI